MPRRAGRPTGGPRRAPRPARRSTARGTPAAAGRSPPGAGAPVRVVGQPEGVRGEVVPEHPGAGLRTAVGPAPATGRRRRAVPCGSAPEVMCRAAAGGPPGRPRVQVVLDMRHDRQQADGRAGRSLRGEFPRDAEHGVGRPHPLLAEGLEDGEGPLHVVRRPVEQALHPPLELLLGHLLAAGHLHQRGPRRGVLRRQLDRLLGQSLRLLQTGEEGAELLLAGQAGGGGAAGGPRPLQRQFGADGVDDRVRRAGGEPLLDPLRVVDRLLGEHDHPVVATSASPEAASRGGGRLPLAAASGRQRVGQVDVVADGVHGDDLVAPELPSTAVRPPIWTVTNRAKRTPVSASTPPAAANPHCTGRAVVCVCGAIARRPVPRRRPGRPGRR